MAGGEAKVRGRYAPTPSGLLHVGNARTALVAWLSARAAGGSFILRVEDLDGLRTVPGADQAALQDLAWLGLDWDEGPDVGGPHAPYHQSARHALYEAALERLAEAGRIFPCGRSRKDLADLATAPHGPDRPYPKGWRPAALAADWFERFRRGESGELAIRFRVGEEPVRFKDRLAGAREERVDEAVGDFVLRRRDGVWAYQLAVVVDDLAMGVTEVVRGVDLLSSTARQIQLIEALGGAVPAYAHVPLVVDAASEKLSKRHQGLTLHALRAAGTDPRHLVGSFAASLGLLPVPEPCRPEDLLPIFEWAHVAATPWQMPNNSFQREDSS